MGRRKYKSWRVRVKLDAIERLGRELVDNHDALIADGYEMCRTSGLWRTRRGTLTARIAYRSPSRKVSVIHTIRGIRVEVADA